MTNTVNKDAFAALTQIIHSAAQVSTIEDQVQQILVQISDMLAVDVCSLYRLRDNGSLGLVASHGLIQTHPIVIPPRQGLVGQVMRLQRTINIADPDKHPDYFYVANSKEETFHSFCGVPLIHRGKVNGVLVVQSRRYTTLDPEQVAVLSTLAIHLALLLESYAANQIATQTKNRIYKGIPGAQGVAAGTAFVLQRAHLSQAQKVKAEDTSAELAAWNSMKQAALEELSRERRVIEKEMGEGPASVLDAHQMMLQDSDFDEKISSTILDGYSLPWALKQTVEFYSEHFMAMDDPYLRARHEDIEDLGDKLYQLWLGETGADSPTGTEPLILIGDRISLSAIADLVTRELAAIVCAEGASLSHIAVFANALGIPAVMGVRDLLVRSGDALIVDGDSAEVICSPSSSMLEEYRRLIRERQSLTEQLLEESHLPAITKDQKTFTLMANSGLQADVAPGLRYGAEGIGLYRTEIPFMLSATLPSEQEQEKIYRKVLEQYRGKPVYLRTLDIGSDKSLPYLPTIEEDNPALGLRGIRYTLDNRSLLKTQLRAMLKAAGNDLPLYLLLPMISSVGQLDETFDQINKAVGELRMEGRQVRRPMVGIMVEVPASIALLPFCHDRLDFISIGTNDLIQYLLAIDRNNPLVSRWFETLHPSVLHELMRITGIAKEYDLPVSVCGEIASDPVAVVFLMGMDIRQLSMSAAKIPLIKSLIRLLSQAETEQLLATALTFDNAKEIRKLGLSFLAAKKLPFKGLFIGTENELG